MFEDVIALKRIAGVFAHQILQNTSCQEYLLQVVLLKPVCIAFVKFHINAKNLFIVLRKMRVAYYLNV